MTTYGINVKFKDGSIYEEEISSTEETVWPKKGFDYKTVDTKKFQAHWIPYGENDALSITEYKRGFKDWLDKNGLEYTSVTFKKVE